MHGQVRQEEAAALVGGSHSLALFQHSSSAHLTVVGKGAPSEQVTALT